jgi:uncharacterized membrane protein
MENSGNSTGSSTTDPKLVAIISYVTPIGWIIAYLLNNPKSDFASFHIRQALGIIIIGIVANAANYIPYGGGLVMLAGSILALVLWIMGLVSAVQGEEKPVPVLGEKFQEWFKSV